MNNDTQGNPFKAAYDEASSELTKVIREFEQLRLQREHVEKVVKVLKPAAGLDEVADMGRETPADQRSGFTVLTHISVVRLTRKA
ncbi:MAG: hypothetical protein WB608_15290 [Terracidiphilus sp.]